MIKVAKDFQSSVNIAYDLHNEKKIKNFIVTNESIELFEEIFTSTQDSSTKRSHILIGAYGKGKSHIVLEILNLLLKKDKTLFDSFLNKLKIVNSGLFDDTNNYLNSDKKLLPIIISGSSTSLSQAFLLSLYQTLKHNDFVDLMPDTNFTAAINTINRWKKEFPATYKEFHNKINIKVSDFVDRLKNYDAEVYADFVDFYPLLTSGSEFNPFTGFDIVELYEKVTEKLIASRKGYRGLYVVYDEFSKYLESSINKASINDIKLLQDFAEKCCRSGKNQMHLLLISHKEISNYIDTLPKEKVDGWKGVSDRFIHIVMHSDYAQVYEIMNAAIPKNLKLWKTFMKQHNNIFSALKETQTFQRLFVNSSKEEIHNVIEGCYPLHPVTTYILPRFSEKIAQNERTLFTFLSSDEKNTLASCIKNSDFLVKDTILLLTPDLLFDYFDKQMRGEPYTSPIKSYYNTTKQILHSLGKDSLEAKIVKTLSLIYCLNQFERLPPTNAVIHDIYKDVGYLNKEVTAAIENLLKKECCLYLRRSNNYLQLKESTGTDIETSISNMIEKRKNKVTDIQIINSLNMDSYLYPIEYNTNNEMTRYFEFKFILEDDLLKSTVTTSFESSSKADGVVLGVLCLGKEQKKLEEYVRKYSEKARLTVFVVPTQQTLVVDDLRRIDAVKYLKAENANDALLCDEYDLIEQDLNEIITNYIRSYTHPEFGKSFYYVKGERKQLFRKAAFTHLLSQLCEEVYTLTPVVNNEPLNKKDLTGAAKKSRALLIDAILNSSEADLGINGGQELSFKRSTLVVPMILDEKSPSKYFDTESDKLDKNYRNLFAEISSFIEKAKEKPLSFEILVDKLTLSRYNIGMRLGVIPIYVAVVLSKIVNNIIIKDNTSEVKLNAETICNAMEKPCEYFLAVVSWSKDKENYINKLEEMFADYLIVPEKQMVGYNYLLNAIIDWVRGLPKYSKELRTGTHKEYIEFLNILKTPGIGAQEILFNKTKKIFKSEDYSNEIFHKLDKFKFYYDSAIINLEDKLIKLVKCALNIKNSRDSLCSCGQKFIDNLDSHIAEHKFENHAEKLYQVFASCGNDENKVVKTLAVALTGINTVDWSESTVPIFEHQLTEYIETLKNYKYVEEKKNAVAENYPRNSNGTYFINFVDDNGISFKRNFAKVKCSKKANALKTEILNTLDEYGQSISNSEKRQVLIKILEDLSK